jgi:hypothetical protein
MARAALRLTTSSNFSVARSADRRALLRAKPFPHSQRDAWTQKSDLAHRTIRPHWRRIRATKLSRAVAPPGHAGRFCRHQLQSVDIDVARQTPITRAVQVVSRTLAMPFLGVFGQPFSDCGRNSLPQSRPAAQNDQDSPFSGFDPLATRSSAKYNLQCSY